MAEMGLYCKAYHLRDLRRYDGWTENLENLRPAESDEGEEVKRTELTDDDYLYVQENHVVTDGIYLDENIIFDQVTDEWKAFLEGELGFEIPEYQRKKTAKPEPEPDVN